MPLGVKEVVVKVDAVCDDAVDGVGIVVVLLLLFGTVVVLWSR